MFGLNAPCPTSLEVILYLDELDVSARLIGAVNTVVNKNGILVGFITQMAKGFLRACLLYSGQKMTTLGAGGAATIYCSKSSFGQCQEIFVFYSASFL